MVYQNYALWPHMNVDRNVRYGLDVRRVSRDEKRRRLAEILRLVQMTGYEKRLPAELSGGQQQRVAVARALVVEPDVVLLDEPLSNLDAKLRLEMRAEIRRIHRNAPRTMIYVTHDQKEALSMADRVALMRAGRIVQVGRPEEMHLCPESLFSAQFIGNCNTLAGTVREVRDGAAVVETPAGTLTAKAGDESLSPGGAAVLTVRPELLRSADADAPNAFSARVLSRMYLGEMVQYQLDAHGLELTATVLGSSAGGWTEGETVTLAFDREQAVAFAPDEETNA